MPSDNVRWLRVGSKGRLFLGLDQHSIAVGVDPTYTGTRCGQLNSQIIISVNEAPEDRTFTYDGDGRLPQHSDEATDR